MSAFVSVVGARPNFIKLAAVHRAFVAKGIAHGIVHTGQHYDFTMAERFFRDLAIPRPDVDLEVGSLPHGRQTGLIMEKLEPCWERARPRAVLTYGDVNSTLAAALVASKMGIFTAHIEAGFRSYDRAMPEEINRVVADAVSDLLFTVDEHSRQILLGEGVPDEKIRVAGNTMIDTLTLHLDAIERSDALRVHAVQEKSYAILTLHRPSNVDNPEVLRPILEAIAGIAKELPLLFPIHPRTRKCCETQGLIDLMESSGIRLVDPLGYIDFVRMIRDARVVLSDSGGVQDEAAYFGVPLITLRERTEKLYTLEGGLNRLTGSDPARLLRAWDEVRAMPPPNPRREDGRAAARIVDALVEIIGR